MKTTGQSSAYTPREITNPRIYASLAKKEQYNDPSLIIIKDNEKQEILEFLGILNSTLATFFHFNNSPKATKGAFPKILVKDIKEFPLPLKIGNQLLSNKVEEVIKKKKENKATFKLEKEIDIIVFKLYDLNFEEVQTVLDHPYGFDLTQKEYESFELEIENEVVK